jgi:pentatricopeptide repeat protein
MVLYDTSHNIDERNNQPWMTQKEEEEGPYYNDDDDDKEVDTDPADNSNDKLWSYVYNLQKARKTPGGDTKPAKSLVFYLNTHPIMGEQVSQTILSRSEVCERALTQALRLAGEVGDYRLVLQLVHASISYANHHPMITPRIFGEALDALSQTQANVSKMKQVWNLAAAKPHGGSSFLSSPMTAFELNVLLKSLASRGKTRACVDLYLQHASQHHEADQKDQTFIRPDAYTASTLFSILTDSVTATARDQKADPHPPFVRIPSSTSSPSISASVLEASLATFSTSPCWQWNKAMELIPTLRDASQWNNHAYSSLLKLQDKAQELFHHHENGPRIAMAILDAMMQQNVVPDVVTCTLAMKAMGDPRSDPSSWKLAVTVLEQMKKDPNLPNPNEYSYSAAIVACARCREYNTALELLNEMRTSGGNENENNNNDLPRPNTWVYNAALSAIGNNPEEQRQRRKMSFETNDERLDHQGLSLRLLEQMKRDQLEKGMDTRPDTVTYNTVLAIFGFGATRDQGEDDDDDSLDDQIIGLINQMKDEEVPRDAITYRSAVLASSGGSTVLSILRACLEDSTSSSTNNKQKGKALVGKAAHGLTFVFNSALSVLASQSNFKVFKEAFSFMQENNVAFNEETTAHIISVLGRTGKSAMIAPLLTALGRSDTAVVARKQLAEATGLHLPSSEPLPPLGMVHYTSAISVCLMANELEHARGILVLMRENGVPPTVDCMQSFSLAYARGAIRSAAKDATTSMSRAQNAYSIAMALKDPSPVVLSTVAKACAVTGQWEKSQAVLRLLHKNLVASCGDGMPMRHQEIDLICGLHSTLLRECAKQGNVTAALWYANDIQRFAKHTRSDQGDDSNTGEALVEGEVETEDNFFASLRGMQSETAYRVNAGMRAEDWVSLIKAASKSGHWRVCVNTLQFLRPHLERTNPAVAEDGNDFMLDSRYEQYAPALTAATRCLEIRSQYAWAVRAIEDWMEWSGRKPRPEAVLATIRILSARGRGEEVKSLLFRCAQDGPASMYAKKGVGYEEVLYIGAITALHNNGLYDDADEVFISGITQGYLPFAFEKQDDENVFVLDLHGLNVAMAHSAVRVGMRRLAAESTEESKTYNMMVITGRGRNSALRMRPVLRPEVQRMLLEEFYPPLNTVSAPGNTGALLVFAEDISAWQVHQQEQKGARMLALADMLKNLSTTTRLRKSIALTLEAPKGSDSS